MGKSNLKKEDDGVEMKGSVKNSKPVEPPTPEADKDAGVLKRLEDLEKQNQILRESVRQDKLMQADERVLGKEKSLPVGHLKYLQGKLIVKWYGINEKGSKAKQEIIYHNNVAQGEKMIGHFVTIDGEDIICDSVEFTRSNAYEYFDRIAGTQEDWIVKFHNPELASKYPDYEINITYINP